MKLAIKNNEYSLIQAYGKGVRFTMYDNDLNPLYQPVFCKDYLNDVIWAERTNKYGDKQYGFIPVEKDYKNIENDILHLGIDDTTRNICTEEYKNKLQAFLNLAEEKLNFIPTEVVVYDNALLINYSSQWIEYPYLYSLFGIFVRIGLEYNNSDFITYIFTYSKGPDGGFIYNIKNKIKAIFEEGILPVIKYEDFNSIGNIHNSSGIVATNNDKFKKEEVVHEL